jgi:hypothetical protein
MPLGDDLIRQWFDTYLDTFSACVRGEVEMAKLLRCYGIPLIITTDDGLTKLMTDDEATAVMQGLVDGLRANGYHHTEVLQSEILVLNSFSSLYRGTMSRRTADGAEIDCPTIAYLIVGDVGGPRIAVLASQQ